MTDKPDLNTGLPVAEDKRKADVFDYAVLIHYRDIKFSRQLKNQANTAEVTELVRTFVADKYRHFTQAISGPLFIHVWKSYQTSDEIQTPSTQSPLTSQSDFELKYDSYQLEDVMKELNFHLGLL